MRYIFFFDDTDLARDPNSTIGFLLKDASEVESYFKFKFFRIDDGF